MIGCYIPPAPNPEIEQRVREVLQRIDPLLDIRWMPCWVYNERFGQLEGRYVLTCRWPYNDPRYRTIEHHGETFDILGAFCVDVQNPSSMPVAPEAVLDRVIELLASCDGERTPHLERMRRVHEANQQRREELTKLWADEAEEAAERACREVLGGTQVAVPAQGA